jgi:hypothetical protein
MAGSGRQEAESGRSISASERAALDPTQVVRESGNEWQLLTEAVDRLHLSSQSALRPIQDVTIRHFRARKQTYSEAIPAKWNDSDRLTN